MLEELLGLGEGILGEGLAEPDNARAEQARVALRAVREGGWVNWGAVIDRRLSRVGGGWGKAGVINSVDGEKWVEGVVVVILLNVIAVEAFDIK